MVKVYDFKFDILYFFGILQNDPRVEQQFKRLEDLAEGRSRRYTDADGFHMLKKELSDHRLSTHQPPLRRGTCTLQLICLT